VFVFLLALTKLLIFSAFIGNASIHVQRCTVVECGKQQKLRLQTKTFFCSHAIQTSAVHDNTISFSYLFLIFAYSSQQTAFGWKDLCSSIAANKTGLFTVCNGKAPWSLNVSAFG